MDADKLAFLEGSDEGTEDNAVADVPEVAAPAPEPKGETVAPPATPDEGYKSVPLTVVLDEREKRQAAEREREELRKKLAEYEAKKEPQPDFYENPEAAFQRQQQYFQQVLVQNKLQQSRFLAEREFGEEKVRAAYEFFDQNPHLSQSLLNEPSPFHAAVQVFEKHQAMAEIGDDPKSYRAKLEAELRAKWEAERAETAAPVQRLRPPVSLAAAPSNGKGEPTAKGTGFDAAFPG